VAKQPAAGGPAKVGYAFYDDSGHPFPGIINLSRQNGNPGRVAGDKRIGATNFITECEVSLGQIGEFQTVPRWANNDIYQGTDRYVAEQIFSLNPTTLVQKPVTNAWDYVYGSFVGTMGANNNAPQCSRTGGRPEFLDNGNIMVMIDDKNSIADPAGEVTTFAIIKPDGTVVKGPTLVDPRDIWDNACAFKGGFAIRVHNLLYFYDNDGNLLGSTDINITSGLTFGTGREDASRVGSDIRSYYVYLAGQTPETRHAPVRVAIWDTRTFACVGTATVSELDPNFAFTDRTTIAVDALDRFTVAYRLSPTASFPGDQIAGRVGKFDGTNITWLTPSFYPFVNHDAYGGTTDPPYKTEQPSVAMTTRAICFSAKGTINSTNNPAATPDTVAETALYTVIAHPVPVAAAPRPALTATLSGSNVIISWNADAGGQFTLLSSSNPAAPLSSWAAVSPQPPITGPVNNKYSMTVPIKPGNQYFGLKQ